jgi:hypothetical protein
LVSLDSYDVNLLAIKNALKATINSTVTFRDKITFKYIENPPADQNPFAHGSIVGDQMKALGVMETLSMVYFKVEVAYICAPTEDELDILIGYIGEIIDAIEADRHLGDFAHVDNTEVTNVTYGYTEGDQALVRMAVMDIAVRSLRNM